MQVLGSRVGSIKIVIKLIAVNCCNCHYSLGTFCKGTSSHLVLQRVHIEKIIVVTKYSFQLLWNVCGDICRLCCLTQTVTSLSVLFSLSVTAQMGVGEGKSIGEWFGPNTVAQVLK